MAEAGYGRVVNISSSSAFGMPMVLAYGTAKSALIGLTKIVAIEGAELDIKVNALMPTAMTRMTDNWFGPAMDQLLELPPGTYSEAFPPERVARRWPCSPTRGCRAPARCSPPAADG